MRDSNDKIVLKGGEMMAGDEEPEKCGNCRFFYTTCDGYGLAIYESGIKNGVAFPCRLYVQKEVEECNPS